MSDPNQQPFDPAVPPAPPTPPAPPAATAPPAPPAPPAPQGRPAAALSPVPGIPIVLTPIDPPAQAPFARPAPSPYQQDPFGAPAAAGPTKSRRWLVVGGIVAGVVIVLGVGAAVGANVVSGNLSADKPVDAFLTSLVDGEAESALAMLEKADDGPLLSDEVYREAENRITGFTLGEPTVDGEKATVVATITQGDEKYDTTFALASAGKTLLFWNDWKLAALPLASVAVDFDAPSDLGLEVGGAELDRADLGGDSLYALPGDYAFSSPDDNANYTAESAVASVVGFGGRAGVDPIDPVDVSFPVTLTDAGAAAALASANADIDACAAQAVLEPAGCGFSMRGTPGIEPSNIRWTVTTRPTATFGAWDGGGFPVVAETSGRLDFAADGRETSTGDTGTLTGDVDGYSFRGSVTFVDGAAVYASQYGVIDRLQDIIEGSGT